MSEQENLSDPFIQPSFCRLLPQLPFTFLVHSTISLHKQAMVARHARTPFQELQVKVRLYSLAHPCFQGCNALAVQENGEKKISNTDTVSDEMLSETSCFHHTFHMLGVIPGLFFAADVGVYLPTGSFIPLVRSDVIRNPWIGQESLLQARSEIDSEVEGKIGINLDIWANLITTINNETVSDLKTQSCADKPGVFMGFHPIIFPYDYEQFCGYTLYPYLIIRR